MITLGFCYIFGGARGQATCGQSSAFCGCTSGKIWDSYEMYLTDGRVLS